MSIRGGHRAKTTGSESFPRLSFFVEQVIDAAPDLAITVQIVCHSMGNYLLHYGAKHFAHTCTDTLLVAAMLDNRSFDTDLSSDTPCGDILHKSDRVSIYYSHHDDVLPDAPVTYAMLGIDGPESYTSDGLAANVVGVACTHVCKKVNADEYETGVDEPLVHTSYFFIPEVLADMASTLMGGPGLDAREPIEGTSQGFRLPDEPGRTG